MRRYVVLLVALSLLLGLPASSAMAVILTPVDANSSSAIGEGPDWLVERAAVDHAATFDVATGESGDPANQAGIGLIGYVTMGRINVTYATANAQGGIGLIGHFGRTMREPIPVSTPALNNGGAGTGNSMLVASYPLFWDWRPDAPDTPQYPKHSSMKPRSMWLSAPGENSGQWIEIELPRFARLQQLWIWNFNDGPEINRATSSFKLETVSTDPGAGLVNGKPVGTPSGITYDVNHGTFTQVAPGQIEDRPPDWVINLGGTKTRYIRLSGIRNFGTAPNAVVGIGPILVFDTIPPPERPADE